MASLAEIFHDYLSAREINGTQARADACWCILIHHFDLDCPDFLKPAATANLRERFEDELLPAMEKNERA